MLTASQIREWYDQKYSRCSGKAYDRSYQVYDKLLDLLGLESGKKLLDIGCGASYLPKAAVSRNLVTYGVDLSVEALQIAADRSPEAVFVVSQGEALPFPNQRFDYVTAFGSLEHFLDIPGGLREMKRVANERAVFCIMVPNRKFIYYYFQKAPGTEQYEVNENLLSMSEWKAVLSREGFIIDRIYSEKWYDRRGRRRLSLAQPLGSLKAIARFLFDRLLPVQFCYQFIFICRLG